MKYVVTQNQNVNIDVNIRHTDSEYSGQCNGQSILWTVEIPKFKHTQGLNFINLDLRRFHELWSTNNVRFNALGGVRSGILLPKTDATLLGKPRHNEFHLSSFGFSGDAGISVSFMEIFLYCV